MTDQPITELDAIYTDADGGSALARVRIPLFVPGGPDVVHGATGWGIVNGTAATEWGNWHLTRNPGMSIVLDGGWEVEVSSGERRSFTAGGMVVLLDTEGQGHRSRINHESGCRVLGVRLDATAEAMLRAQLPVTHPLNEPSAQR